MGTSGALEDSRRVCQCALLAPARKTIEGRKQLNKVHFINFFAMVPLSRAPIGCGPPSRSRVQSVGSELFLDDGLQLQMPRPRSLVSKL